MWIALLFLKVIVVLVIISYYDILPRIYKEFYIRAEGQKFRRVKDKDGYFHLQKKYFPGIWMDVTGCDIIVPAGTELPGTVSWRKEEDNKYIRKFIKFNLTPDPEVAYNFEQLLIDLFKNNPTVFKERKNNPNKNIKYESFTLGEDNETSIEKDRKI